MVGGESGGGVRETVMGRVAVGADGGGERGWRCSEREGGDGRKWQWSRVTVGQGSGGKRVELV